jgi:Flp pilus assembly pilin Flp
MAMPSWRPGTTAIHRCLDIDPPASLPWTRLPRGLGIGVFPFPAARHARTGRTLGRKEVKRMSVWRHHITALLTAYGRSPDEHGDEGQGLAEYALILSIIAIASIIVLAFLGGAINSALSGIGQSIGDVT